MKKVISLLFCFVILCCFGTVLAEEITIPDEWQSTIDASPITADEFQSLTFENIINYIKEVITNTLTAPLKLLARLCAVIIIAATLNTFYANENLSSLTETVITIAVFTLCYTKINTLILQLSQLVEESRIYLSAFIPIFSSAMATCGQLGGATVYNGMFFASCMLFSNILCNVGVPILRVYLALNAIVCSGNILNSSNIVSSVERWIKWILTFTATAFAALLGLQTALAQSTDNVMLKASRFIVGSSVPVIGRAVSDAVSSVIAGLKLIKGTLGFSAIAVICSMFIPIIINFCIYHIVFSVSQIAASGVGMNKVAKLFDGYAKCISLCISMLFLFLLMVVASTMIMILIGGFS